MSTNSPTCAVLSHEVPTEIRFPLCHQTTKTTTYSDTIITQLQLILGCTGGGLIQHSCVVSFQMNVTKCHAWPLHLQPSSSHYVPLTVGIMLKIFGCVDMSSTPPQKK